jgi:two-component system, OmpR family, sensor kinase
LIDERPRRPSAPLFIQVWLLLLVSVVTAQVINLTLLFSLPPPLPDLFALAEVAAVLREDAPPGSTGASQLIVTVRDAPPRRAPEGPATFGDEVSAELARTLGVPSESVRVTMRRSGLHAPPMLGPRGKPGQARGLLRPVLIAPFEAAVRRDDGRWRVVSPRPRRGLSEWQLRLLVSVLASAAVVAPLAYVFARRLSAPIAGLAAAAERFGRDLDAPPLKMNGGSELRTLVDALNQMQARLRRYLKDRTAMLGAVAHDLRTPLTRMRFHIEPLAEEPRRVLARDVDQMEAMIRAVLAFVRDAQTPAARTHLEITSLLESIVDDMVEAGADLTIEPAATIVVEADPVGLRRLFSNLLENAVKFGGRASVRAGVEGDDLVVRIDDAGPGLPDSELNLVFEPFYRAEPSRSRDTGGIGLGLASARSIAQAHGGDVTLANIEGGLRATVRFPLGFQG